MKNEKTPPLAIRPAQFEDIPALLMLIAELAGYEDRSGELL